MPLSKLYHSFRQEKLPCILCLESKAKTARLCNDCWESLNWKNEFVQRNSLECFVSCSYEFPIKNIIHKFKDQTQFQYLDTLTACILSMPKPRVQAIVPMPLSTEKLIHRGFDHTLLIAKSLSKIWSIPIWQPVSRHAGQSQKNSDWEERLANVNTQLFLNTTQCKYKHILMIDDVITTGASLAALKLQLTQLGCTHIYAACICDAKR